jgi:hypothetical protein
MRLHDVLLRKHYRRNAGRKASSFECRDDHFRRNTHFGWRTTPGGRAEVHDEQSPAWPERSREVACVLAGSREMVPHVHNENAVLAAFSETRGARRGLEGAQVGELVALRSFIQEAHHAGLEIGRYHLAFRNRAGKPHREVARARSDVGDAHRW